MKEAVFVSEVFEETKCDELIFMLHRRVLVLYFQLVQWGHF